MTRRTFLAAGTAALAAAAAPRAKMGVATTSYMTARKFKDTLEFLEHCHSIGAAGIQSPLTSLDTAYLDKVERRAKDLGMYVEVMCSMPGNDMGRFTATLEAAKRVGALCVRAACLSGRRYENFSTMEEWNKFVADSKASIAKAVPVAERLKLPFTIENHKDWTVDELVALLRTYSSDYFGVCLDAGNNIALLDDPMEVVERLAPYTISTHIKDMGLGEYEDGFLTAEVVLGEGILDLQRILATIQKARPATRLTLEMITRDPLKVPALTDKYWATMPERSGAKLARTLRAARSYKRKLPSMSDLSPSEQIRFEEDNVRKCLSAIASFS